MSVVEDIPITNRNRLAVRRMKEGGDAGPMNITRIDIRMADDEQRSTTTRFRKRLLWIERLWRPLRGELGGDCGHGTQMAHVPHTRGMHIETEETLASGAVLTTLLV